MPDVRYANFKGRQVAVEVTHVPAWGGGSEWAYEGVLRISPSHRSEDLRPLDGRAVTVMAIGVTDEVFLSEDLAESKP